VPSGDTVLAALSRAAQSVPGKVFLDFEGAHFTYGEIERSSSRMASAFRALGVASGEIVSSIMDNTADCVRVWFALNKAGAIWSPVNTALRRDFLQMQLADSGCKVAICEAHYLEQLLEVAGRLPKLECILVRGEMPVATGASVRIEPLDAHRGTEELEPPAKPAPGDIACVLYTSGTTGPSKGCLISHNYLCNQARQSHESTPVAPNGIIWCCLPLFHIGVITMTLVAALLLKERASIAARFSVSGFWPEIERSAATVAVLLSTMPPLLASAPDNEAMKRCHGQLQSIWCVPFPRRIREIWKKRFGVGWINCYGYGMTEGGKIFTYIPGETLPPEGSVGHLADDFDAIIADNDDREVAAGTVGEVLFRPKRPNVMFSGYWNRPEATTQAWRNLWMHSGDLGKIDAEGFFYFVDRKKDCIRRRGENISIYEFELVLGRHPDIHEGVVHPVPSSLGEDDVKVTAVLKEGSELTAEALCRWCIENFPYFAVPRYYEFRTGLPKTPTGRVMKYQLKEEGCTPATWDMQKTGISVKR
jgi:crotonobetaine/carnitine-CoA ligase